MSETRSVEVLGAAVFAAIAGDVWDLLLSWPLDVDGAVQRTTPVEGGVGARVLAEGAALASAGSSHGVKALLLRCCWRPCTSFSANIAS